MTTAIGQMLPDEAGQRAGRSDIDEVEVPGLRLEHVLQRLTKQDGLAPDLPEMFIGQRLDPRPGPAGNDRYARRSKVKRCAGEGHGRAGGVDRRRVKAVRDGQLDGADAQPLHVAQDNFELLADAGNHEMPVVVDTGQGAALVQYRITVVERRVVQYGQHHARLAVSFNGLRLLDQSSQHRLGRDGPGQRRRHEFAQAAAKQVIGVHPARHQCLRKRELDHEDGRVGMHGAREVATPTPALGIQDAHDGVAEAELRGFVEAIHLLPEHRLAVIQQAAHLEVLRALPRHQKHCLPGDRRRHGVAALSRRRRRRPPSRCR